MGKVEAFFRANDRADPLAEKFGRVDLIHSLQMKGHDSADPPARRQWCCAFLSLEKFSMLHLLSFKYPYLELLSLHVSTQCNHVNFQWHMES